MTEQGRKLGIRERRCGLHSPPLEIKTLILSKRDGIKVHTCLDHPNHLPNDLKISASTCGTTASSWTCSQQSPPLSGLKISVVNAEWNA